MTPEERRIAICAHLGWNYDQLHEEVFFASGQMEGLMTPKRASELIAGRLIDLENRIAALEERLAAPPLPRKLDPGANEVRIKEWVINEAARCGVTLSAIYNRLNRGYYRGLKMRRVHGRVAFVQNGDAK